MATFKAFPVINMAATGANIQRLRKRSGYTVSDLQDYFGFDAPQAIYKWQRGETLPSTDNLLALGYLLDVPIEKILVFQTLEQNETPSELSGGDHLFGTMVVCQSSSVLFFSFGASFINSSNGSVSNLR